MTYFHWKYNQLSSARIHGPVRNGKGWFRFAMVTRLKRVKDMKPVGCDRAQSIPLEVLPTFREGFTVIGSSFTSN